MSRSVGVAELLARARDAGVALTGEGGLLTDLMRSGLQRRLGTGMAEPCRLTPEVGSDAP